MEYIVKGEPMEKLNWMIDEVAHRLEEENQNHDVARLVVPEECREIRVCGEEFSYGRPVSIYGVPHPDAATVPVIKRIIQGRRF